MLDHVWEIRRLTNLGWSLDEIVKFFGTDWAAIERRYPLRKLSLKPLTPPTRSRGDATDVWDIVASCLVDAFATAEMQLHESELAPLKAELTDRMVELYRDGCSPVLLVAPPRPHVVADFQVSTLLSNAVVETAYLVVPLTEAIAETLGETSTKRKRLVRPAQKVLVKDSRKKERELAFTPGVNLSFEIETE